jgi:CheY-like chemotaxis protein
VLRFAIELHRVYPGTTIPVAAILHDPSPERRTLLKDAGYAAVISKPFTRQSLLHALQDMLRQRG